VPRNKGGDTDRTAGNGDSSEQALEKKLARTQWEIRPLIRRSFPRSFRGYKRAAVDGHLALIVEWLSFSRLDDLIRGRFNEHDPVTRQLREQAERDVEQVQEDARREADRRVEEARDEAGRVLDAAYQEADRIKARARDEAETLLADAHADAPLESQGRFARLLHRHAPPRF
jgi:regulator of protease activity HflC (stomatin/prohibitin superfamily)